MRSLVVELLSVEGWYYSPDLGRKAKKTAKIARFIEKEPSMLGTRVGYEMKEGNLGNRILHVLLKCDRW